jgi:hypothetical protein
MYAAMPLLSMLQQEYTHVVTRLYTAPVQQDRVLIKLQAKYKSCPPFASLVEL